MLLTRLSRPTSDINSESDLANEAINPEAGRPHEEIDRWIDDTAISYFMAAAVLCALAGMEWLGYLAHSPRYPIVFSVMALVRVAAAAWRVFDVRSRVQRLRLGRDGERVVVWPNP
jgi:hypothetical protein